MFGGPNHRPTIKIIPVFPDMSGTEPKDESSTKNATPKKLILGGGMGVQFLDRAL